MSAPTTDADPYFLQLVLMFQGAAYQHMGKIMNPATQKVERDLEQARHAIDLLNMLEAKTKGNLSEDEAKLLEHTLYELRMNYVEEANKGETRDDSSEANKGDTPAADSTEETPDGDSAPDSENESESSSEGDRETADES